jgi:phage virion morphogenesis protein
MENELIQQVNKILLQMQKKYQNIKPVMTVVAAMVAKMIGRNFVAQGRWNGNPSNISILSGGSQHWKELSGGYASRVLKKYNTAQPTLYRTGNLKRSIEVNPSPTGVVVTANTAYARIHQLGGRIRTRYATIDMPPRPYLTITPQELKEIVEYITQYVLSQS